MSRRDFDKLSRREALGAMAALAGVAIVNSCGGSDSPTGTGVTTTPTPTPTPTPTTTAPTPYPVTGDWITPVFLTETQSGRSIPYQLFIPVGATPTTPLPLVMHVNGSGQRGASGSAAQDPTILIQSGLADIVNRNKTTVPQAFYFFPMQTGGPDPAGERYARNFYLLALADVLSKYNIDTSRMHLSGYSAGALSVIGFAYRHPKVFASLSLWDGLPRAWTLTNEQDQPSNPNSFGGTSDVLAAATYPATSFLDATTTPAARAEWARVVGDIPLNYQHGALDLKSFPAGPLPTNFTTQMGNDFTVRENDPATSPNQADLGPAWFSTFTANGQTVPTTVAATTSPSPSYSPTTKHVYVPYSTYDHGALNSFAFPLSNPWWAWWQARVRSDYV